MKNIFSDKASVAARKMLAEPGLRWVIRDFVSRGGLSLGMAQGVLSAMEQLGCLERVKKGPGSYARLSEPELLLSEWVNAYKFGLNTVYTCYAPEKDLLKRLKSVVSAGEYALTLHTGANLLTGFVASEDVYVYLRLKDWKKGLGELKQKLDLKELVRGGNIHLIRPFYRHGAFYGVRKIKGYPVVSNLQLYLDLYNFQPRGREHAIYLKEMLERGGKRLG